MKKDIKKFIKVAEKLDWSVDINENEFTLSKYSPCGQDFSVNVTAETLDEVIEKIRKRCDSFDCSEEAYYWLDNSGHGINGAPYDMKDLYEDMESCLEMMKELHDELIKINQ